MYGPWQHMYSTCTYMYVQYNKYNTIHGSPPEAFSKRAARIMRGIGVHIVVELRQGSHKGIAVIFYRNREKAANLN